MRTIPNTSSDWPNWNSSTATSAWWSAGSAPRFPAVKSLDTFDFPAIPSVNKALAMELARCEYVQRRENVIAVGNSGTGKTHVVLGLGLAACQRGMSVGFTTATGLHRFTAQQSADLYELILNRHRASSFVITSNRAVDKWLGLFEDPVLGNSALDRLANPSYQIVIEGSSLRGWLSPHRALLDAAGQEGRD